MNSLLRIFSVLKVVIIVTIVASLFFTTGVLADGKPRAYVLIGDVTGIANAATNTALEAKSDYEEAGYEVIFINEATKQNVIDALKDNETQAICIIGHGKYDSVCGSKGKEKLTNPVEMIDMNDTYIEGSDFTNETLFPNLKNIKQVTLHACGQDNQSWRALFPNADFRSWKSTVRGHTIFWWQWWNEYDPVTSNASVSVPTIDPILEQEGQFYFEEAAGKYVANMSYVANNFPLHEPLKSQFGSQNFNFYAIDTSTNESQILFGADIENGTIVGSYANGTAEPTFNVSVTNEALFQILEQPSEIWDAYTEGDVQIIPYVAVEEDILFKGMARLIFGVREISVGGIAEFPQIEEPGTVTPDLSEHNYGALAGIIVAAIVGVIALISAVWYVRRRRTKAI